MMDLGALGDALRGQGYTAAAVRDALKEERAPGAVRTRVPVYLRRLDNDRPLSSLATLFTLARPVSRQRAETALGQRALGVAIESGILELRADQVHPLLHVTEYDGLFIAHDIKGDDPLGAGGPEFVLGPNPAATTLAVITPRSPVRRTLDLACGSGLQGLLAAPHSEHVVGSDINPRALRHAALSAGLSGVANVEWREGDLFEPVRGERFDLIVANPPFVISPDSSFLWRDSGRTGGGINEQLVRELPSLLAEGGLGVMLLNWPSAAGEHWDAPLRRWLEASACDAWLLLGQSDDPLSYAASWTEIETAQDGGATLDRWLAYFRTTGIETVHFGAIIVRRREGGRNWIRADVLPATRLAPAGEHLLRAFQATDLLARLDDSTLMAGRISVPAGHAMEQLLRSTGTEWEVERLMFRPEPGVQFPGALDGDAVSFLLRCDGRMSVRDALGPAADLPSALGAIRRMLLLGFVEFEECQP